MGTVHVNGKTIHVPNGANISIFNDKVFVNGKPWNEDGAAEGIVKIVIEGTVADVKCDAPLEVKGSVEGNVDCAGSVHCGNITGPVDAGGSLHCGNIGGNARAGGSIKCSRIAGDAKAGGSIRGV
jgi:hypothetical protein